MCCKVIYRFFFFRKINRLNFPIRDRIPTRPQRPIIFITEVAELGDLAHIRQWQRFEGKMMRAIYNLNICLVICLLSIIQLSKNRFHRVSSVFESFMWYLFGLLFFKIETYWPNRFAHDCRAEYRKNRSQKCILNVTAGWCARTEAS